MRRGLRWALGAAVLASAVALLVRRPVTAVVQAVEATRGARALDSPAAPAHGANRAPLPATLPAWPVPPARRDPFTDMPPPTAPPPPPPPAPLVQVAPPPPAAPTLAWRYLGTLNTPEGRKLVMISRGNEPGAVVVEPGMRLDDGYEVQAVSDEAIRLLYPPLQYEVVITCGDLAIVRRNVFNAIGATIHGNGTPFQIKFSGSVKAPQPVYDRTFGTVP